MRRNYERDGRIRAAIDASLSGVDALPTLRYKVLQAARGEQKVKKKISLAFVQALLMLVIAVGALATTVIPDLNGDPVNLSQNLANATPIPMANPTPVPLLSEDPLPLWSDEDVLELVSLLREDKMGLDGELVAAMDALPEADKAAQARLILTDYYSDPERGIQRGSVLWPWDMKALECELQQFHHHFDMAWERYMTPREGMISYDEAWEAAVTLLYDRFTMPEKFSIHYDLDAALVCISGQAEPTWRFRWWIEDNYYQAELTPAGEPVSWTTPYTSILYTPHTDILADAAVLEADPDIMAEMIEKTVGSVTEIGYIDREGNACGFETADVEAAEFDVAYIIHPGFNYGLRPVWILEMRLNGELLGRVLRDDNGDYLCTAFGDRDFQRTISRDMGSLDQHLGGMASLRGASAEAKAEKWLAWKPAADAYLAANPSWADQALTDELYGFTQLRTYLSPAPSALTAQQAISVASQEAILLGANPDTMDGRDVVEAYLLENGREVWRIVLTPVNQNGLAGDAQHRSFFAVTMDAYTGEVLHRVISEDDAPAYAWYY